MTTTLTQTFNRDDIRRVYASFAADYRIIADWTGLQAKEFVDETIYQIKTLAEELYLKEVHIQLLSKSGTIREAVVYGVSTNASSWSSDRPGDLYWTTYEGDRLYVIVDFSQKWKGLPPATQREFAAIYLPGWGATSLNGVYDAMTNKTDRHYSSRAYGMDRTRYTVRP